MPDMNASNPFDFFDAIYCLTTEERAENYESALKEFESIGIADRVIKFNGSEVDRKYWGSKPKEQRVSRALASASHLEIWKTAEKSNLSNVLIFEDDVAFVKWDNDALAAALNSLAKVDWELFYLGYNLFGDSGDCTELDAHLVELKTGTDVRSTHAY
jgi:GR25 family glycosyltransferase involved in LPS biosynthesis